jgi:cobaltochelatase CobS
MTSSQYFPANINSIDPSKIDQEASAYIQEANQDPDRIGKPAVISFGDAGIPGMPPAAKGVFFIHTPADHEGVVPLNPEHVFDDIVIDRLLNYAITREWVLRKPHQPRRGLIIFGDHGTGKTTFMEQRFAQRGIPLYSIVVSKDTIAADLIQNREVVNATTYWSDGVLLKAMREGVPVLINEFDRMSAAQGVRLNEIIEKGKAVMPESGEVVFAKRGFFVNITCNSAFSADHIGIPGAQIQDKSVESRFYVAHKQHPTVDADTTFLEGMFPQLPPGFARQMAIFADHTRKCASFEGGAGGVTLSAALGRRELIAWAELILGFAHLDADGIPVASYTLKHVYSSTKSPEEQAGIDHLLQLAFAV